MATKKETTISETKVFHFTLIMRNNRISTPTATIKIGMVPLHQMCFKMNIMTMFRHFKKKTLSPTTKKTSWLYNCHLLVN
ncbi:hypothetical protein GYO_2355 [Bacillus spizizenii TU-B-10]|uniref:Uncharacterized protein n=1 Tax=Bacillus spizizenii (strain DSM 15029 / JCM 12233 / NBRC 101239 / NRRL B-23049 / TU-B-10) TaxID=1052585 RepID=G4NSB4_BACS4|nr:hypothetical protein GYO_2355 [Bacillus spizizenii TU-B-10]